MKQLIKSLLIGTLGLVIASVLFNISVKAQSVEGTSWKRSAENGKYSSTYKFYKQGKVTLYSISNGKPQTRSGTYTQNGDELVLNFPAVKDPYAVKLDLKYKIQADRLRLIVRGVIQPVPDIDTFKRVNK